MNYRTARQTKYRAQLLRRRRRTRRLVSAVLLICVCIVGMVYLHVRIDLGRYENSFYEGIYLNDTLLTGMSYEEAFDTLAEPVAQRLLGGQVVLSYEDKTWTFHPIQFSATSDVYEQLELAQNLGHVGNWVERQRQIKALRSMPVVYRTTLRYDEAALDAWIAQIKAEVDVAVVNATVTIDENEKLSIMDAREGLQLNAEALKEQLIAYMNGSGSGEIQLQMEVVPPNISPSDLESKIVKLGSCTTSLEKSSSKRTHNVKNALFNFNGLIVQPGERVSFNQVVGKRTEARGYLPAPEFYGTSVVEGIGGGVCQASTTVYGAVLRAGLQINERHNHRMVVDYVKPSLDAAVADNSKDMVFTNITDGPLYIFTKVMDDKAKVTIYGTPVVEKGVKISLESVVIERNILSDRVEFKKDVTGKHVWYTTETKLLSEGKLGMRSESYRLYLNENTGEEVKREKLSTDYYYPQADVYWVGVHEPGEAPN